MGVIEAHLVDNDPQGTGIREKDISITHNLHALNNYLISGLVQERKRTDAMSEKIDKLEYIVRELGYEPLDGKTAPRGSYDQEVDQRILQGVPRIDSRGMLGFYKIHGTFDRIKQIFKKKKLF